MKKKIKVEQLINDLEYKVDNIKKANLAREINGWSLDRKGLELSGLAVDAYYQSKIIGWGTKEKLFFDSLKSKEERLKSYNRALTNKTPLLFLSKAFNGNLKNEIIEAANSFEIPVISLEGRISEIQPVLNNYLTAQQAVIKAIHASFVIIHGMGILIKGASGIGKSEAVLELIHNNHIFVSDDTVETYEIAGQLFGKPAPITKDFLEARGIGLVNIPYIYGTRLTANRAKIDLVIELVSASQMDALDRLGNQKLTETIQSCVIPKMQIPAGAGRSTASLIEAAVNVFLAKKAGFEAVDEIRKRRIK